MGFAAWSLGRYGDSPFNSGVASHGDGADRAVYVIVEIPRYVANFAMMDCLRQRLIAKLTPPHATSSNRSAMN